MPFAQYLFLFHQDDWQNCNVPPLQTFFTTIIKINITDFFLFNTNHQLHDKLHIDIEGICTLITHSSGHVGSF